jgi:arylamine N-acetyltransferase
MAAVHTAPIFCCGDRELLDRFFRRHGIDRNRDPLSIIEMCAAAFSRIPYENLTKIIKSDLVLSRSSALRFPDEVLADHLRYGTGGTCFSLTAALIAVFNALGIEAQPLLADRHYGPDTHCGLVVKHENRALLIDPGFLIYVPTPLPSSAISAVDLGYTTVELRPVEGGNRIELATSTRGTRKVRLTYRRSPVDAEAFQRAWEDSFTWEMMTYPVLTRCTAGRHLYLQGNTAMVRSSDKTVRSKLEAADQIAFIGNQMGIARSVVLKAWEAIRNGTP